MKFNFNSTHIRHKKHQLPVNEAFDFMAELEDIADDSLNMQSTLKNQLRYENLNSYLSRAVGKEVDYEYDLAISTNDRDMGVFMVPGMNKCLGIKWVESEENIIEITWLSASYYDRQQNLQLLAHLLVYCDKYQIKIRRIKLTEWSVTGEGDYSAPKEPLIFIVDSVGQVEHIINAINSAEQMTVASGYSDKGETGTINFVVTSATESEAARVKELKNGITKDNFICNDIITTIEGMSNLDSAIHIINNGMDAAAYFKSRHIRLPKPEVVRDRIEMYKNRTDLKLASTADMNLTLSRSLMYIVLDAILFHEDALVFGIDGMYTNPSQITNSNYFNYASYNTTLKQTLEKFNFAYPDFINMLQYMNECKEA